MMTRLRQAIEEAAHTLGGVGVASSRADAEELAAHAAGTSRGRLPLLEALDDDFFSRYHDLVASRAKRVPLQHIIGTVSFGPVRVDVGPGVFTPRPETEALLEWAVAQNLPASPPVIVDLCTGSAALAAALAYHKPSAHVIGVEVCLDALTYARRNTAGTSVELRRGDVRDPALFGDLDGRVDLVVANPPYLPDGAELQREVAEHDPPLALFGGPDGTSFIAAVSVLAGRWLVRGGLLAVEHDESSAAAVSALLQRGGIFDDVTGHRDFAGRPRFVTARRTVTS